MVYIVLVQTCLFYPNLYTIVLKEIILVSFVSVFLHSLVKTVLLLFLG